MQVGECRVKGPRGGARVAGGEAAASRRHRVPLRVPSPPPSDLSEKHKHCEARSRHAQPFLHLRNVPDRCPSTKPTRRRCAAAAPSARSACCARVRRGCSPPGHRRGCTHGVHTVGLQAAPPGCDARPLPGRKHTPRLPQDHALARVAVALPPPRHRPVATSLSPCRHLAIAWPPPRHRLAATSAFAWPPPQPLPFLSRPVSVSVTPGERVAYFLGPVPEDKLPKDASPGGWASPAAGW